MKEHKTLRLKAEDLDDLTVVSSMLQDALVPQSDIQFTPHDGNFVMVVNRFCWEDMDTSSQEVPHNRVLTGIRFTDVKSVAYRNINRDDQDKVQEILTFAFCDNEDGEDSHLVVHFAGGGAIRLTVSKLNCALEDLGESWPTSWKPKHEDEG